MNINDMFKAADAAEEGESYGDSDLLNHETMPAGTEVLAKIVWSQAGTTKSGGPKWSAKLEVLDGPLKGESFFDGIYLSGKSSEGAARYNKAAFAKLAAAGLGADFFAAGPSHEATAQALKSAPPITITAAWQKPSADGTVWGEHIWSSSAKAGGSGPAGFSQAM